MTLPSNLFQAPTRSKRFPAPRRFRGVFSVRQIRRCLDNCNANRVGLASRKLPVQIVLGECIMASVLFSPLTLRSMHLENRIVVSPLAQFMADESGNATDWHLMHLGTLAVSGAGLLITEAAAVEPRGAHTTNSLGLW